MSSNEDFIDVSSSNEETAPDTTFEILIPQKGYFVMVLDRSASMDDFSRLDRLKQSVSRWLKLDVQEGSFVGITSFS